MADSDSPLYKKGYRAGRARTEAEIAEDRLHWQKVQDQQRVLWNATFMALLPIALAAEGWQIDGKNVHTSEHRMKLAQLWTDRALAMLKS